MGPGEELLVGSWRRYVRINLYRFWCLSFCLFHLYKGLTDIDCILCRGFVLEFSEKI
jgi:hypothetical protein